VHLAWKGEEAHAVELQARLEDEGKTYEWSVRLTREAFKFSVHEEILQFRKPEPPSQLLLADRGRGWWWSGGKADRVSLAQPPTTCALAAAAVDESFPARGVAEFVRRWGFYDPSPFLLRRGWTGLDSSRFDPYGRNLAERLFELEESFPAAFQQILSATQSVLGLPSQIELRESREPEDRAFFVQHEPGLRFPVHQVGASSGTLRMLALMTALFGETESSLIGIEEPENHVHPTALEAFAQYLLNARDSAQILVTTHSPLLLDFLNDAEAVCVVRQTDQQGTRVTREGDPEAIRQALEASGFGLGEFYATKGFGG
jgi:predicted ATPase